MSSNIHEINARNIKTSSMATILKHHLNEVALELEKRNWYIRESFGEFFDIWHSIDSKHDEFIAQINWFDKEQHFELSSQGTSMKHGSPDNEYMCLYIYGTYKTLYKALKNLFQKGTNELTGRKPIEILT